MKEQMPGGKQTGETNRRSWKQSCCWKSYDLIAITETWWDESHDWNVALDGYRLFRRDRRGRRGGGVALYIKKTLQSEELSLKNNHEQVESLWVRIGEATKGT